jgi:hypothetical protein
VLVTEKVWHGEKEIWGREGGRRKGMSTDDEDFKTAEPEGRGAGPFYKRGRRRERVRDSERRSRGNLIWPGNHFAFGKTICLAGAIRGGWGRPRRAVLPVAPKCLPPLRALCQFIAFNIVFPPATGRPV